jgi:spore germination cell wall hydrolase CwlJ-like protein
MNAADVSRQPCKEITMEKILKPGVMLILFLLAVLAVQSITARKLGSLRDAQMVTSKDVVSIRDRERQLDCLAKNIYHEAANEPFEGKVAVAQVTMNRTESGKFPSDVCGVVYQKNVFMEKVVCQFSWYCEHGGRNKPIRSQALYNESYEVAKKVLLEGFRLDIMKTALFYHADYVNPKWGKPKIGKIGNHIFYADNK